MSVRPSGLARWRTVGTGSPITVVVPGLGATEGEARIAASGISGTRVIVTLPGHGAAPDPPADYWDYTRVAADVAEVADQTGATRALGVSLGAGAITRLLAGDPGRFDRVALLLPAVLDTARATPAVWALCGLAEAVERAERTGDERSLIERVSAEIPAGIEVGGHVRARVAALRRLGPALRALPDQVVLTDRTVLRAVSAPVMVISAVDDPLHAENVARSCASAFRHATLEVIRSAAPMITHRHEIRRILAEAWA